MAASEVSPEAANEATDRREWLSVSWKIATTVPSARVRSVASICQQQFGAG
jgi:hypothetical protein